ncbi:hypothetical protein K376_00745 [Streptomyces sp. PsTaAH-130]|nr:hypothetical protein K376_00745 [Streptomyces sp. PsTaAH-130]
MVTDSHPTSGIKGYDVFYFDDRDLSGEVEDAVIKAADDVFAGLPAEVEVRNEARVHLWYERKFGVACAPYSCTVRPNPVLAPREVYETKAARWRQQWPELTVLDWPSGPGTRATMPMS